MQAFARKCSCSEGATCPLRRQCVASGCGASVGLKLAQRVRGQVEHACQEHLITVMVGVDLVMSTVAQVEFLHGSDNTSMRAQAR